MGSCVIFCAGEFNALAQSVGKEDWVIAADGGLVHVQKLGLTPNCILGDFDSLGYVPQNSQVFPVEKDDTDAMLAARQGLARGYREFLFYGGMDGPRADHMIANFQTLSFLAAHGARGYLVGKSTTATVVKNETVSFPAISEGIVSLFCLGEDALGVTIRGLQYPLEDGTLTHSHPLGVSNHFVGEPVSVRVAKGELLMLYPTRAGFPKREGHHG